MKEKSKKCITLIVLVVTMMITMFAFSGNVYADYQIRPNFTALRNVSAPTFWYEIRLMETDEGPMGLSMPNTENNVYQGYGDNNIDVHLMRNCEWGVVSMLQMSGYGSGISNSEYSSGNVTGVKQLGNDNYWEYTASIGTIDGEKIYTKNNTGGTQANAQALADKNVNLKYFDLYYLGGQNNDPILTGYTADDREKFYQYNYKSANSDAILNHVRRCLL